MRRFSLCTKDCTTDCGHCKGDPVGAVRQEYYKAMDMIGDIELMRCWTNEDGKQFIFAEDLWAIVTQHD